MKKIGYLIALALLGIVAPGLQAKFEREQIQIETQLQERIEGILAKTLSPNSYLVTVKVEMEDRERTTTKSTTGRRTAGNSLLGQNQYVLPGVPGKKEFATAAESTSDAELSAFSVETLVKRITISILVANDVTPEQIRSLRDVITASIPFNPLRGDEMQVQTSSLLKTASSGVAGGPGSAEESFWRSLLSRGNAPVLIISTAVMMILILFIAFLFGPMRAFLNRLLAVLPRVGEQAAYTVSNAPSKNGANGLGGAAANGGMNGSGVHDEEEDGARPFRFIREDQLTKLPILCRSLSPAQCALILAYLPAAWASKVLAALDSNVQTTIMRELSQAREVPPEVVKELEEHIKAKLPYLVGGSEWIQSVYQLTQPQIQRSLLGTLNQQSPELAQALRRKTFFLEDLGTITPGALRLLLQETGYPVVALALREEKPEVRESLLRRLPVAMREVLQQELDMAADDKTAINDSKNRLLETGRRLLMDGRIALPERK